MVGKSSNKRGSDGYKRKIFLYEGNQAMDPGYCLCPWRFSNPNWVRPQATCSDLTAHPVLGKRLG